MKRNLWDKALAIMNQAIPIGILGFLMERRSFLNSLERRYRTEFQYMERIHELGKSLVRSKDRSSWGGLKFFNEILLAALVRTVGRIHSIRVLVGLGNCAEAAIILRSIMDETINIHYIEQKPELRSLLYQRHGSKERIESMQIALRWSVDPQGAEEIKEKIEYFRREKGLYDKDIKRLAPKMKIPNDTRWSGQSIRQMAKDIGLEEDYELIYSDLSNRGHSLSASSHYFLEFNDVNNTLIPVPYPNERDLDIIAMASCSYALRILQAYIRNLEPVEAKRVKVLFDSFDSHFSALRV